MIEVTLIGILSLPLGVALFILNPVWLYCLAVFFVPFSATAVVILGNGFAVSTTMYFGVLWMARTWPLFFTQTHRSLRANIPPPVLLLILFVLVAIASLFTPWLNNGLIYIYQIDTRSMVPLSLSLNHLIHILQIGYGVAFAISIFFYNHSLDRLMSTIKILIVSLVFVALWGFAELIVNYAGMKFPYYLFNNTPADIDLVSSGVGRVLSEIGLVRLSSVCDEPSIAASTLLVGIGIMFVTVTHRCPLFSKNTDSLILMVLVFALFATGSASGIIGFFVVMLAGMTLGWKFQVNMLRIIILFCGTLLSIAAGWIFIFEVRFFVEQFLLYKLDTDSGEERLRSVVSSLQVFESSPIFGGGWGSVTSNDLLVRLMSNVGIVGTAVFLLMLLEIHRSLWKVLNKREVRQVPQIIFLGSIWVTFIAYWFVAQIVGWSYQFQVSFLVLGLAIVAARFGRNDMPRKS